MLAMATVMAWTVLETRQGMGVRCYHGDTDVVPLSFAVFTFSLCSGGGWMVKPLKWFVFSLTP